MLSNKEVIFVYSYCITVCLWHSSHLLLLKMTTIMSANNTHWKTPWTTVVKSCPTFLRSMSIVRQLLLFLVSIYTFLIKESSYWHFCVWWHMVLFLFCCCLSLCLLSSNFPVVLLLLYVCWPQNKKKKMFGLSFSWYYILAKTKPKKNTGLSLLAYSKNGLDR